LQVVRVVRKAHGFTILESILVKLLR
jgi:hypothetical protein